MSTLDGVEKCVDGMSTMILTIHFSAMSCVKKVKSDPYNSSQGQQNLCCSLDSE